MESHWNSMLSQHEEAMGNFSETWNKLKHDGVFQHDAEESEQPAFTDQELKATDPLANGIELALYEKMSIGTGKICK